MIKLNIKPLSVNQAWQGRRFKTNIYKNYEKEIIALLPKTQFPEGKVSIEITFGFSNKSSDIDNPLKPFLDILQKKYGFNDKDIYKLTVNKEVVKKGNDFIEFSVQTLIV